ncbi:hypothetical protein BRD13_00420 [Halobacteriales archaeon SW_5_70_135]|nr:MAG: hypothetical protein BRD13_00420 [Halobacteriales archaeon SW_5_70_135]
MGEGDTLINAVIGAVAAVVLSFTGVGPVLGGAVAGYLQRGSRSDGLVVGALAGLIGLIPLLLMVFPLFGFFSIGTLAGDGGALVGFGLVTFIVAGIGVAYSAGLSAVGGYLGAYVALETEFGEKHRV